MTRNRASAKKAGTAFESLIASTFATELNDDRIERRAKTGARDRGDIGGLRIHGQRLVIECKNTARMDLPAWTREAATEAGHDDALAGVVIHKRHGNGNGLDQWVSMDVRTLIALITGQRQEQQ